jgi:broad specificity phosphatase PhoE
MMRFAIICAAICLISCSTSRTTYYVVRHAEKSAANANMTSDVPLSAEGEQRAQALKASLDGKGITQIYSTNYIRTMGTARPLSEATGVPIHIYDPRDTGFLRRLKDIPKGKVLVVGHSNTVDELVNGLTGESKLSDLPDSQYGDLFIIRGKSFKRERFGN